MVDLRDFKRNRNRSFYKIFCNVETTNLKAQKTVKPYLQGLDGILRQCDKAKKFDEYVTDPLTYEKILRSLDINRSNFVDVEEKKRRRFYDTIRTIDYLNHEKEEEVGRIMRRKGAKQGYDYLPIHKEKRNLMLDEHRTKEFHNEIAGGVKFCLDVYKTRILK